MFCNTAKPYVYKRLNLVWKNFEERCQAYRVFEFLFSTGIHHKTGSSLVALYVVEISEGKESFTHCLIRLMCGTHDHPEESHNR